MTRGIEETLNLPSLEEALREKGLEAPGITSAAPSEEEVEDVSEDEMVAEVPDGLDLTHAEQAAELARRVRRMKQASGEDHEVAMDSLHKEGLSHARSLIDLAFNIDHARARGIFEQAANFYKIAMDSKNSKRDAQLKAMKLALDQRRVELEERKLLGPEEVAEATPVQQGAVMVEDRNELLRRWREKRIKD